MNQSEHGTMLYIGLFSSHVFPSATSLYARFLCVRRSMILPAAQGRTKIKSKSHGDEKIKLNLQTMWVVFTVVVNNCHVIRKSTIVALNGLKEPCDTRTTRDDCYRCSNSAPCCSAGSDFILVMLYGKQNRYISQNWQYHEIVLVY